MSEGLALYPGRGAVIARMVISSVLVMLLVVAFRIPGAALAGYYTLLLSRESPHSTLAGAVELILSFAAGVGYVLLSALFFFGSPILHLLWVIASFSVIFLAVRILRSYSAAAGFGFLIATCIPVWDRAVPPEVSLDATLWTAGSVALGAAVRVGNICLRRSAGTELWIGSPGPVERYRAGAPTVAENESPGAIGAKLHQFATVGVSRLRRMMLRSADRIGEVEQIGTVISLTERLVDLTAALTYLRVELERTEANRLLTAATRLHRLRLEFQNGNADSFTGQTSASGAASNRLPLLPEIERDINMLSDVLRNRFGVDQHRLTASPSRASRLEAGRVGESRPSPLCTERMRCRNHLLHGFQRHRMA